jgi:hypothetical protein
MLPSMARTLGQMYFVLKGNTFLVMEEFNLQSKLNSFYKYCPGSFGYTVV